jgi:hypothetical protein
MEVEGKEKREGNGTEAEERHEKRNKVGSKTKDQLSYYSKEKLQRISNQQKRQTQQEQPKQPKQPK